MREKIDSADRQAAEARKKALECTDDRMKDEWAKVARMWEELANEYREVQKARAPA
ncbi:MAG TPA: hypothetical protein VGL35_06840 [Rhizomicrobium sp.]|jgi:hypothetical protein